MQLASLDPGNPYHKFVETRSEGREKTFSCLRFICLLMSAMTALLLFFVSLMTGEVGHDVSDNIRRKVDCRVEGGARKSPTKKHNLKSVAQKTEKEET